jgi:pyruvate dehydrogenase E1 component alpha subunit
MRDAGYRTREEIDSWRARDPLRLLRDHLLAGGDVTEAEFERIDAAVATEVSEGFEIARNGPWPDPATALNHIYAGTSRHA